MIPTFERVRLESPGLQAAHEDRPSLDDCNYNLHKPGAAGIRGGRGGPVPQRMTPKASRAVGRIEPVGRTFIAG